MNEITEIINTEKTGNTDVIASHNVAKGSLMYLGKTTDQQTLTDWQSELYKSTTWNHSGYEAFGRWFDIPRQQAWIADKGIKYRYSDNLLDNQPWTPLLRAIKNRVEQQCNSTFNSVLLTLYRDGNDSVDWHSDDEQELGNQPTIASLSLGESRDFLFREKSSTHSDSVTISHGDLWLMRPDFQKYWQHAIGKETTSKDVRINLTFRKVIIGVSD